MSPATIYFEHPASIHVLIFILWDTVCIYVGSRMQCYCRLVMKIVFKTHLQLQPSPRTHRQKWESINYSLLKPGFVNHWQSFEIDNFLLRHHSRCEVIHPPTYCQKLTTKTTVFNPKAQPIICSRRHFQIVPLFQK